jgi:hypothetical protein
MAIMPDQKGARRRKCGLTARRSSEKAGSASGRKFASDVACGSINDLKGDEAAKADQSMQWVDFRPSELWKMRAKVRAKTKIR